MNIKRGSGKVREGGGVKIFTLPNRVGAPKTFFADPSQTAFQNSIVRRGREERGKEGEEEGTQQDHHSSSCLTATTVVVESLVAPELHDVAKNTPERKCCRLP